MRYRVLGRTGLKVSELCLGTMTFGSGNHRRDRPGDGDGPKGSRRTTFDALAPEYPGWMLAEPWDDRM